jgi:glycerophosphoryl diester phosphodiesterase
MSNIPELVSDSNPAMECQTSGHSLARRIAAGLALASLVVGVGESLDYAGAASFSERAATVIDAAHRGQIGPLLHNRHQIADEDTTLACENAIDVRANVCESDIHFTRDHVPIIIHDATLNRTTNCRGAVSKKKWLQIAHCETVHGEHIPKLASYLKDVRAHATKEHRTIGLEQEIKSAHPTDAELKEVVHLQARYGFSDRHLTATSMHRGVLKRLETLEPNVPKSLIAHSGTEIIEPNEVPKYVTGVEMGYAALTKAMRKDPAYVHEMQNEQGVHLAIWNADTLPKMKRLVAWNVAEIVTRESKVFEAWRRGDSDSSSSY